MPEPYFRNRWWMVFASVIGLIVNTGVIGVFLFGSFLKPVSEGLGITREQLSVALLIGGLFTALGTPLFGKAIDYFGIRRVHLPMIVVYAIGTAALSLLTPSMAVIVLLFMFQNFGGTGQSPVAYSKTLAGWFDKDRGLALGIAIAGVGLGVVVMPQYANYMIGHYGWRAAYVSLGIAILVLAFIPVAIFMRDPPATPAARRAGAAGQTMVEGATWSDAFWRSWRFWAMTAAFFFVVIAINGTLGSIIALLTDRGLPRQVATNALSLAGLGLFVGRILSGYLLDRWHGPYVACLFFISAMFGIGLLAGGGAPPLLCTILCGLGIGAEVDLMAFLVSRYFGLKAFGAIYGTMFAFFAYGNSVGIFLMSYAHTHYHTYVPMLILFEFALAAACLLMIGLGPYRFAARTAA
ncbi:MAG: MFS transporter, partial [Stellaceae bacterium]